jgi:hypothetical protein
MFFPENQMEEFNVYNFPSWKPSHWQSSKLLIKSGFIFVTLIDFFNNILVSLNLNELFYEANYAWIDGLW